MTLHRLVPFFWVYDAMHRASLTTLGRDQLLEVGRRRFGDAFDRSVDVQVSRLRRKIEPDESAAPLIKTVRGAGYVFVAPVERA